MEFNFEKLSDAEKAELMKNIEDQEKRDKKNKLNLSKEKELNNLVINNISCSVSSLFMMAVKYSVVPSDGTITWIGADNTPVVMTKDEFGQLISKGTEAIEEIYFRYRKLKDKVS